MKYYNITFDTFQRSTDEMDGTGGFLIMAESEEVVKAMIEDDKKVNQTDEWYQDNYQYNECSADDYIKYYERFILMHVKKYYIDTLKIDSSLPIREYN